MQTAFLIYNLLYLIALIFFLPLEYFKRPTFLRKRWIKEKFGFLEEKEQNLPKIWIHAVSVGEVIAVSRMIRELSEHYKIILSTITDTGQKVAQERFKDCNVKVVYMPFDISWAIKRFLKHFSPVAIILTETELWPNLIRIASKTAPVILVNGRISDRSFRGYYKIKFFIKHLLKKLSLICVQENSYKEKFITLGAEEEKINVTGNMKFDIELKTINFPWENKIPHPIILAGSTHEPEEELILNSFISLGINGTLIIAPRHPERFGEIETLINRKITQSVTKIQFSKLSEMKSFFSPQPLALILLVDQMGILGSLYRICDIAVIGGSFIPHGGQNPLEPSYWKKPIICGPYMHNFPFIEEFIKEKACLMADKDSLMNVMRELVENYELRQTTGNKAYQLFLNKSGATQKTLKLLKKFIP
ncbi:MULTISPECIES: 3-deoxy-D-manno-octulosonic acid transferase [Thermodesulfovibrio]|uniref:3-deoxy-D-manno-octulosonic acid transferase n=1 Tax=Thermodesulfovibrio yellowstonii TaxID=28262 RepID=A0A9W6GEE6_9BACT|nr:MULTISPECIES: 3-deoxy-D-manno-octulosonic acid transferase [Thermodesulfovibrio]GLI53784.1 3-deoxy-D-manno-octulosonic acid transferase [Thermodesulfovibrio islandicus]